MTFSCRSCGTPWMVLAMDAAAEGRALDGWTCPVCTDLSDGLVSRSGSELDDAAKAVAWLAGGLIVVILLAAGLLVRWLGVAQ